MKFYRTRRPAFAPTQAFVVQCGRDTAVAAGRMVGRVEHVVSGKAGQFQSLDELVILMTAVRREVAQTTHHTC